MTTTLHTIKMTTKQKEVLVRIYTSATPEIALAETEFDEKNITAAEILEDIEAIEYEEGGGVKVTQQGVDLMKQQGLIDDDDQLTQEAEQYKLGDSTNTTDDVESTDDEMFGDDMGLDEFDPEQPDEPGPDLGLDDGEMDNIEGSSGLPKFESIIRTVHNALVEKCTKMEQKKTTKKQQASRRRQQFNKR